MPQNRTTEAVHLSATDILDSLERHYTGRRPGQHLLFREFPLEAGARGRSTYRIDGLLVSLSHRHHANRKAIEVKVSRDDFKRELQNSEKRQRAMRIADCFYFAVPHGLIEPNEVPDDCGLLWIQPDDCPPLHMRTPTLKPAPAPDWPLTRDLIWRAFAFGQEDAARRDPLAAWLEVEQLAKVVADPYALDDERTEALEDLKKELLRRGRKREATLMRRLQNLLARRLIDEEENLKQACT